MNAVPAPPARRRIATAPAVATIPEEARKLASQFHFHNTVSLAAASKAKKARDALLTLMKGQGIKAFEHPAVYADASAALTALGGEFAGYANSFPRGSVILDAAVEAKPYEYIAVEKLRGLVTDEIFMKIVGASKEAVVEHAGTAVATQVAVAATRGENVSIRPKK